MTKQNANANANANAPEKVVTATFIVLSALEHDHTAFAVGDEVQLTAAQATPLLGHTVKPKAD